MLNIVNRSSKKELLDSDNIPFAAIKQNMKELNTINSLLGGHLITIDGVRKILAEKNKVSLLNPLVVCEIGCGGGDNINAINVWAVKNKLSIHFIGIDVKQDCIDFAKQQYPKIDVEWVSSSFENVSFKNKPDIIFSSLFCHHFTNEQLVFQLHWLKHNCTTGFFINDLQRSKIAYFLIKWITHFFSKSYLVKNDAPVSVTRGFLKSEWKKIFNTANIDKYTIKWKWAFRHLIIFIK